MGSSLGTASGTVLDDTRGTSMSTAKGPLIRLLLAVAQLKMMLVSFLEEILHEDLMAPVKFACKE